MQIATAIQQPPTMIQQPTCTGIRIRSVSDASAILHACSLGILALLSRRLSTEERRAIHSGCVFVWEERSAAAAAAGGGIERWTDGRRWGPSRVNGSFLVYQEKLPEVQDERLLQLIRANRLVKQTYSAIVEVPDGNRKWHLVAYHSPDADGYLLSVDDIPELVAVRSQIPPGKYRTSRLSRGRCRQDVLDAEEPVPVSSPSPALEYPQFNPQDFLTQPALQVPINRASEVPEHEMPGQLPLGELPPQNKLPPIPPSARRDPHWVLDNYVVICPDILQAQSRGLLGRSASKDLAPLIYMRGAPYPPRHPIDNDAIRSFDGVV